MKSINIKKKYFEEKSVHNLSYIFIIFILLIMFILLIFNTKDNDIKTDNNLLLNNNIEKQSDNITDNNLPLDNNNIEQQSNNINNIEEKNKYLKKLLYNICKKYQFDLKQEQKNNFQKIIKNPCMNNNQNTMCNKEIDKIITELNTYINTIGSKEEIKEKIEKVKEFSSLIIKESINNIKDKKFNKIDNINFYIIKEFMQFQNIENETNTLYLPLENLFNQIVNDHIDININIKTDEENIKIYIDNLKNWIREIRNCVINNKNIKQNLSLLVLIKDFHDFTINKLINISENMDNEKKIFLYNKIDNLIEEYYSYSQIEEYKEKNIYKSLEFMRNEYNSIIDKYIKKININDDIETQKKLICTIYDFISKFQISCKDITEEELSLLLKNHYQNIIIKYIEIDNYDEENMNLYECINYCIDNFTRHDENCEYKDKDKDKDKDEKIEKFIESHFEKIIDIHSNKINDLNKINNSEKISKQIKHLNKINNSKEISEQIRRSYRRIRYYYNKLIDYYVQKAKFFSNNNYLNKIENYIEKNINDGYKFRNNESTLLDIFSAKKWILNLEEKHRILFHSNDKIKETIFNINKNIDNKINDIKSNEKKISELKKLMKKWGKRDGKWYDDFKGLGSTEELIEMITNADDKKGKLEELINKITKTDDKKGGPAKAQAELIKTITEAYNKINKKGNINSTEDLKNFFNDIINMRKIQDINNVNNFIDWVKQFREQDKFINPQCHIIDYTNIYTDYLMDWIKELKTSFANDKLLLESLDKISDSIINDLINQISIILKNLEGKGIIARLKNRQDCTDEVEVDIEDLKYLEKLIKSIENSSQLKKDEIKKNKIEELINKYDEKLGKKDYYLHDDRKSNILEVKKLVKKINIHEIKKLSNRENIENINQKIESIQKRELELMYQLKLTDEKSRQNINENKELMNQITELINETNIDEIKKLIESIESKDELDKKNINEIKELIDKAKKDEKEKRFDTKKMDLINSLILSIENNNKLDEKNKINMSKIKKLIHMATIEEIKLLIDIAIYNYCQKVGYSK